MQSKLGVSGDIGAAAAFSFRAVSNLGNQAVRSVIHDQAAFSRLLVQRISFCRRSKTCGANFYESELLAIYVAYYAPTSPGKTDAAINKEERKECTHAVCVLCLMPAPAEMRFLVLHLFRCFIFLHLWIFVSPSCCSTHSGNSISIICWSHVFDTSLLGL